MIPLGVLAASRYTSAPRAPLIYRAAAFKVMIGSATKTYAGAPIGDPSPARTVIVAVTSWSGGARRIDGVTIGGVPATFHANTGQRMGPCVIASAVVPTGTTADIVVSTSDHTPEVDVGVWTVDSLVSVAATSVPGTFASGTTVFDMPLASTAAGGFAVAAYTSRSNATPTTWTNAEERYENNVSQPCSGADVPVTVGGALTITATLVSTNSTSQAIAAAFDYA